MASVSRVVSQDADSSPLPEIIGRIVAAIDPDRIILFGSRARDEANADGGYDLLELAGPTPLA